MKTLSTNMLFPIVMLAVGLLLLLIRILPQSWRALPLGLVALLLTAMPAHGEDERTVTCYDMTIEIPAQPSVRESKAWVDYRAAYLSLIQYVVNNGGSKAIDSYSARFTQLRMNLEKAENELEAYLLTQGSNDKTLPMIVDGIKFYLQDNQKRDVNVTCYGAYEITPEIRRHDDLSQIVGRQVELQRLVSEKADISELTVNAIKEDMRASISRYLDSDDAALYMDLMMDLVSYMPATSKIMCYK